MKIICILGPESSGKTTLARKIAHTHNAIYIPEYARLYTEMLLKHQRHYTYQDVCRIAQHQMTEWQRLLHDGLSQNRTVVFDTEQIVTQVWFDEVYGHTPDSWRIVENLGSGTEGNAGKAEGAAKKLPSAAESAAGGAEVEFLLTAPDIPWIDDPVRENGSDTQRQYLFQQYENWLRRIGANYTIVRHTVPEK